MTRRVEGLIEPANRRAFSCSVHLVRSFSNVLCDDDQATVVVANAKLSQTMGFLQWGVDIDREWDRYVKRFMDAGGTRVLAELRANYDRRR